MSYLPEILDKDINLQETFPILDDKEKRHLGEASGLFNSGYYHYALLALWNAAISNIRRKVEAYNVEMRETVVVGEGGRKKYINDGESLSERWGNVDDLVLILGATRLGLLSPKAGETLKSINWMRNHASPAHDSDNMVTPEDVIALGLLLQSNLFSTGMPEPGHSIGDLFQPIKTSTSIDFSLVQAQINSLRAQDIRTAFGFFTNLLVTGEEPGLSNVIHLFPTLWEISDEDLRKTLGIRFQNTMIEQSNGGEDSGEKTRILELLVQLNGIKYIPEATRASIYRKIANQLSEAKDAVYGWHQEESVSKSLKQFGISVPSIAFEELYQEILTVYCGNYWGRSEGYKYLQDFISNINTDKIRQILRMFNSNERVRQELSNKKPKTYALELLESFREKLTLESHLNELNECIDEISKL